jgi:2-dehydropantoate 2-reductase
VSKTKIGIVGLGGIGGLLAVLLTQKKYEVFSNKNVKTKNTKIKLLSKHYGELEATIKINKKLDNVDIIFVCSKFPYLKNSIKRIKNKKALIVPLLNGLSHFSILKKKFLNKVHYANIGKIVSAKIGENKITHISYNNPEIIISTENKNKLKKICNIFKEINFSIKKINSNSVVIWEKLVRVSPISSITALYNCSLGNVKKSKIRMEQLENLIKETLYLGEKLYGFKKSLKSVKKEIDKLPNNLTTSLQRDVNSKNRNKSEIETQIGAIYKLATKRNIKLKITTEIYKLLKIKCKKKY